MSPACRGPPLLTRPPPAQKPSHYTQQTQPGHWANEGGPSPYEVFKAAYPDYSENCRKFVSACLSLNQLRRERKIPEFLYDDYIRAHSSDYLLYISECDRKNVETILPAIQWYNETAKQIQYRGGVISKDNIVAVLAAHSDEARAVRRSLGDSQSTASESNAEDGDEEVEDALSADEQEEEEQSRFSPELHIKSPGLPPPRAASTPMQGHDTANDRHASNKKRRLSSPQSANRTKRAAASTALRAATRHEATPAVAGRGSTASDKHTTSAPKEPSRVQSVSRRTHGSELSAPVPSSPPPLRNRSDENKVMAATSVVARPQRANKTSAGAPAQHTHQSKSPDLPPHLIQDGAENEDSDDDAYEPAPRAATVPAAQSRLSATIVPAAAAAAAAAATSPPDRFSSVAPTQSRFKPANRGSTGNEVKSASLDTGLAMARADQDHGTVASETNTPRPRKRVDESPAERSRSFRAFLKARQARTPSSTMPSKM
ncbi:hypothetical protein BD289DRAFT_454524 [Coniella lustricola]|uniref:Uncharacterized protein n=1 Tax=Coniella lustricola TaxID=2025994 RepID=A0A2T3A362_9PEZI|nr:hypothetical protein BD289DRAFT_454524 [Coniella lustricola]